MILICDAENSERVRILRERIYGAGIPCSISIPRNIKQYLPISLIITFDNCFETIRRLPYDDIFVISIGGGFINTALNATGAANSDIALKLAEQYLYTHNRISKNAIIQSGICFGGVFLGKSFFQIFGNLVVPTDTEYMIFKYLLANTSSKVFANTEKIRAFCYPLDKNVESNVVAAHISNLNKKIYGAYGKRIIKSRRFKGYFIDKI